VNKLSGLGVPENSGLSLTGICEEHTAPRDLSPSEEPARFILIELCGASGTQFRTSECAAIVRYKGLVCGKKLLVVHLTPLTDHATDCIEVYGSSASTKGFPSF
jgi:hypothetical protein